MWARGRGAILHTIGIAIARTPDRAPQPNPRCGDIDKAAGGREASHAIGAVGGRNGQYGWVGGRVVRLIAIGLAIARGSNDQHIMIVRIAHGVAHHLGVFWPAQAHADNPHTLIDGPADALGNRCVVALAAAAEHFYGQDLTTPADPSDTGAVVAAGGGHTGGVRAMAFVVAG